MELRFDQLNPGACRTYVIGRRNSKEAALVDPVLDRLEDYIVYLKKERLKLVAVLDTHTHADHISAGPALRDLTGCPYIMHESAPAGCVTERLKDGQTFELAGVAVRAIHAPGHSADSICLVLKDRLLTGDTLFLDDGGAGRDDLPGGDAGAHWESLQKLLRLPDDLTVHPAHEYRGRRPSSLGTQKRTNPHLKPRTKEEFIGYVEELRLGPAEWMKDIQKANYACARDPYKKWMPTDAHACEIKGTLEKGVNDQLVIPVKPEELRAELEKGPAPLLIDVRERTELGGELGHLPGILHIPVNELNRRLAELEPYKEKEIVTVCRSGGRSQTAAQILQQAGFRHVHFMEGGMTAWNEKGYPVEK